jgi:hypothetical protein
MKNVSFVKTTKHYGHIERFSVPHGEKLKKKQNFNTYMLKLKNNYPFR